MAGAPRLAAQADMDLPGQIDQLAAVRRTPMRIGDQQLPAGRFVHRHAQVGEGLSAAVQLAMEGAALRHPEAPLVHGGRQQHGADHHQQDEQQLQPTTTRRPSRVFKVQRLMHDEPPVPDECPGE